MDQLTEIVERAGGEVWFPSEEEAQTVADVLMNDACIPSDAVADEPPKKWRILEPGEVVQEGDLMNSKLNPPSDPPNGGWLAATSFCFGKEASFYSHVYFARAVADEPAKEAEPPKPAEPQYRIPSLPYDAGKECEFSDDNENWHRRKLAYWIGTEYSFVWWSDSGDLYKYARIKKDA
jgi:hypothetical protein